MALPHTILSALVLLLLLACASHGFDINLVWDTPDNAHDITQASAKIQLNATSPIGTEWIGVGWDTGLISVQKLSNSQLVVLMQVRAPSNSTVRAGRVTEYSTAHYIPEGKGMYLQARVDKDDSRSTELTVKVIAHYNMVANNTIYQGLWSDGDVWTYMGSLVLQHPKGSIKEQVTRALEEAASAEEGHAREAAASSDPLVGAKPPETLATCEINRDAQGEIKPVCKFIRQLPMVPSFNNPYSGIRRTSDGSRRFERVGVFKDLVLKSRLAQVFEITQARCVSHNRAKGDVAQCQRDPNNPEFYIAIDGTTVSKNVDGDPDVAEEEGRLHREASKLPEVNNS
ncbi:hypothetical protein GGI25_003544 [Coemansia spiralis]|uniref:Uncharacterized protein n=2 Tax=Coemansia TaxID=4863 RepID=A0A9W8G6X0_9FUNG|nr:hypothetical protein BX070DRAFT_19530 [Coemansia spiralis]KAJ1990434.1 hypothetical protein EDC05_004078 [Coemansia umbellata]KAJ2622079.1 hypothetical protein GGI26_003521 [Coemansia sp. RSA 1358]KAJ2676509.1 hypothetical protein GGI25_003544 [Coemansia spiralis]